MAILALYTTPRGRTCSCYEQHWWQCLCCSWITLVTVFMLLIIVTVGHAVVVALTPSYSSCHYGLHWPQGFHVVSDSTHDSSVAVVISCIDCRVFMLHVTALSSAFPCGRHMALVTALLRTWGQKTDKNLQEQRWRKPVNLLTTGAVRSMGCNRCAKNNSSSRFNFSSWEWSWISNAVWCFVRGIF